MKKVVFLLFCFLCVFLLPACVDEKREGEGEFSNDRVFLSEIRESLNLTDFSDFGLYSVSLNRESMKDNSLKDLYFYLIVENNIFALKSNPLNEDILEAFLPSTIGIEKIESGFIKVEKKKRTLINRTDNGLSVKSIYIERKDDIYDKYGTDLYELLLTDYLSLKNAINPFIFKEGILIRPSFVKSNEENAYTLQRYLNARQASENHDINVTFAFLKNNPSHENLLSFENPNRVSISSSVQIIQPDTRDRLRELGTMGDLNLDSSFDILDNPTENQNLVQIKRGNFPSHYSNTYYYDLVFNAATMCAFNESATPGIQTALVSYDDTQNQELIKNARINCTYYEAPQVNNDLSSNSDFYETRLITLTWAATPGEIISATVPRGRAQIKEYKVYFATSTEDYPEPFIVTEPSFSPQNLSWRTTYKWKVEGIQNNNKAATSTEKEFEIPNVVGVYNASGEYQDSYGSIQEAVTVNLDNGSILKLYDDLILDDQIELSGKELKIISSESEQRLLDRQNNGRGFVITSGASITFRNLTIKNCEMDDISGAAISSSESTVTLLNCTLDSNKANKNTTSLLHGGGLSARNSFIRIENSTITGNYAYYAGGAVFVYDLSELIVKDSVVIGNEAVISSGGIYVSHSSSASVLNTRLENNEISSLNISSDSTGVVDRCTFACGSKDKSANAIFVNINCDLTLTNSTITNYAKVYYGAVTLNWNPHGDDYCKSVIYGNLFKNCNSVYKEAAAIYAFSDTTIYNSEREKWRIANSPDQSVEYVENTKLNLNRYENVTFKGDSNAVGTKVFFVDAP